MNTYWHHIRFSAFVLICLFLAHEGWAQSQSGEKDARLTIVFDDRQTNETLADLFLNIPELLNDKIIIDLVRLDLQDYGYFSLPKKRRNIELPEFFREELKCGFNHCDKLSELVDDRFRGQCRTIIYALDGGLNCQTGIDTYSGSSPTAVNNELSRRWRKKKDRRKNNETVLYVTTGYSPPKPKILVENTEVEVQRGQSVVLRASATKAGGSFTWYPGNISSDRIEIRPVRDSDYTVNYQIEDCSADPLNIKVKVKDKSVEPCLELKPLLVQWHYMDSLYVYDSYEDVFEVFPSPFHLDYYFVCDSICGVDLFEVKISDIETGRQISEFPTYSIKSASRASMPGKFFIPVKSQYFDSQSSHLGLQTLTMYNVWISAVDLETGGRTLSDTYNIVFYPCPK